MGVDPKKANKPIAKLLHAAGLDLDAATRLLAEPPNVLAANHLQQAAEKILAAVRLHRVCSIRGTTTLCSSSMVAPAVSRARSLMVTHGVSGSGHSSHSRRTQQRFVTASAHRRTLMNFDGYSRA
jgi:hypothetical protein